MLNHEYFQSPQYARLSHRAARLLIDLYCQYRGSNNGDLTAAWSVVRERGWTSKSQLRKALLELEESGWIIRTRQGWLNSATLYAVTFRGIDPCGGKLDAGVKADPKPLHLWRLPGYESKRGKSNRRITVKSPALDTGQLSPHGGPNVTQFTRRLARIEG